MSDELTPDGVPDYHTEHMVPYVAPEGRGFTTVDVLTFLTGLPWDNLALGYVHALRPSSIRVTTGVCTLDARTWRVTVIVDENDIIKRIEQEVEVGLYGWQDGAALREELCSRLEGKPPRPPGPPTWHDDVVVNCPYIPMVSSDTHFGLDVEDALTKALIADVEATRND